MNWLRDLQEIQVDLTSYCNAGCGTCARHEDGTQQLQPLLKLQHFDYSVFERLITKDLKETNITSVAFNGNWGDAVMHPDFLQLAELVSNSGLSLNVSTNGSIRNEKWWTKLASVLNKKSSVIFCLDGLEDTHHIYRRKTSYTKIIKNMRAFINAGGVAHWYMTVFNHNKHQIDTARQLAKEYGCHKFVSRKSHESVIVFPDIIVKNDEVTKDDYGQNVFIFNQYYPEHTESEDQKNSKCVFYKESQVQIDPFGSVWPCCYISQYRYGTDTASHKPAPDVFLRDKTRADYLSLHNRTLKDIMTDYFYTKQLPDKIATGELYACRDNCGVEKCQ